ncbi:MAG: hypothetical protein KAW12_04250 [Candidatus Aminicenantes bacterium]|nr:hypothetical protein [Candidatus Aminicenantes bacterium]
MDWRTGKIILVLGVIIVFFVFIAPRHCFKPRYINTDGARIEDPDQSEVQEIERDLKDWKLRERKLFLMYRVKIAKGESGSDIKPHWLEAQDMVKELEEELEIAKQDQKKINRVVDDLIRGDYE